MLEVSYKGDYIRGEHGSYDNHSAYLGNLDFKLTLAGEKAFSIPGSSVFIYLLHNHGGRVDERMGTQQGVNNIEVPARPGKLHQLWWQQQFMDDKLSLLGGLYDLNSEFYVTESAAVFLHPSFGIGTDLSQTGANGPSIFPTSGLGFRVRAQITGRSYGQVVVLDAVPGNPNKPKGLRFRLSSGEGALWAGELGYRAGDQQHSEKALTKLALGAWSYSKKADDLSEIDGDGNPGKRDNQGFYVLAEHQLFKHEAGRRLMGSVHYGVANKDVNPVKDALTLAFVLESPCASRPDDVLGFGIARVRLGQKAQDLALAAGDPVVRHETAYEITYRAKINDWLNIQPEFQYIKTQSNREREKDIIVGLRLEINLAW